METDSVGSLKGTIQIKTITWTTPIGCFMAGDYLVSHWLHNWLLINCLVYLFIIIIAAQTSGNNFGSHRPDINPIVSDRRYNIVNEEVNRCFFGPVSILLSLCILAIVKFTFNGMKTF